MKFISLCSFSMLLVLPLYNYAQHASHVKNNSPNIILLIGDGIGVSQISAANYKLNNRTAFERFEYVGLQKVHPDDESIITDSAASGTAIACGIKTRNGMLGMDSEKITHKSILEISKALGYKTALIVTSTIVHATPASFYAKVESRRDYQRIAKQLTEVGVDVFIGGGEDYFTIRDDGENLLDNTNSHIFVNSLEELKSTEQLKIGYLTYPKDPPSFNEGRSPSLVELVPTVLEKLQKSGPFFLMIESSQIDWGGHAKDIEFVLSELIEFDSVIDITLDFAETYGNTLVVATGDHETGGLSVTGGNLKKNTISTNFANGSHTATMLPVFSSGVGAKQFSGIYENTEIFHKLVNLVSTDNLSNNDLP